MDVTVLLDEPRVFVSYASATVFSGNDPYENDYDIEDAWRDQANGLCGAAVPGVLHLTVGTHTGWVPFRVELLTAEPPVDDTWEEIVEASFTPTRKKVHLLGLDDDTPHRLALPRDDYRVRYSVRGIDEADHSEDTPDAYLLQFWPGPPAPDRIVKQTSPQAAYWHRARRPPTEQEQAAGQRREAAEAEAEARERWGDRIPNERLRAAEGLYLSAVSELDINLEFALAGTGDGTHREVAAWVTLRCLDQAGLLDVPAFAPAVAALRHGRRVPAPFDDSGYVWSTLNQLAVPRTSVPVPPDGEYEQSPQDWAASAVFHSALDDSLAAVLEVLVCLAYVYGQQGYRQAFAEVRTAFPQLSS
ncbi:hypothetical protein [Actinoplanes sp. NPDC049599]|uniref:hypothetical protein n=1 Tax=Actinoplanes sp. NPDC049599 TaxID=3363903 RepID=UPI0037AA611E